MKQKRILLFVAIHVLLFVVLLSAQGPDTVWTRTYGGTGTDEFFSVQETSDSCFIIAGWTNSYGAGGFDVCLIKIDVDGYVLWEKFFGGTGDDIAKSVQETSDGGYIVAGSTTGGNIYLIKTDENGDTLWTKTYVGNGNSVQQTSDGGYIVAGYYGSGSCPVEACLVKTDTDGDTLWRRGYKWGDYFFGYFGKSVQQCSDGGYIVAGWRTMYDEVTYQKLWHDPFLLKVDSLGNILWQKTFSGVKAYSVKQTSDRGYVVVGYGGGYPDCYVYLIKTDSIGDTLWTRKYGGPYRDYGFSVSLTSDSGYIITGSTWRFATGYDVYLVKTDSLGNVIWESNYGGIYKDWGYSVQEILEGGYIIAGYTASFGAGGKDGYIIKTNANAGIEKQEFSECVFFNLQTYPNPFRDKVKIKYSIGRGAKGISLKIYDVSGREIRTFMACDLSSGALVWDGRDNTGEKVSAGVYFLKLEAGTYKESKKLLMVR